MMISGFEEGKLEWVEAARAALLREVSSGGSRPGCACQVGVWRLASPLLPTGASMQTWAGGAFVDA